MPQTPAVIMHTIKGQLSLSNALFWRVAIILTADDDDGGSALEAVQFGYTESATHFNLIYLTGENDSSVFPGM